MVYVQEERAAARREDAARAAEREAERACERERERARERERDLERVSERRERERRAFAGAYPAVVEALLEPLPAQARPRAFMAFAWCGDASRRNAGHRPLFL